MKIQSYKSNEIGVEFKVWAPTFNRVTHRLYLLGSLKELGAWAIEAALEAFPTIDLHIWKVEAALPPMSHFEWVWLKINVKTKKVAWERPFKRNRIVGCFSGVLHTVWGAQEEVFLQSVANVDLTTHKKLEDGYVLVLTGGTHNLGNWNLNMAVPASEFPIKSGFWKVSVAFDAFTNLDFKWVVVKDKDRTSVLAQEKVPHHLYGRQTWMRVAAPWMTTSTVVVDSLPLSDKLDSKRGRTDLLVREKMRRLVEIRAWLGKAKDAFDARQSSGSVVSRQSSPRIPDTHFDAKALTISVASLSPSVSSSMHRTEVDEESSRRQTWNFANSDRFQSFQPVFAIKGVGQTKLQADIINAGCLRRSGFVPEDECRVLGQPSRTGVSLWSLSMGLVKRSLSATGKQDWSPALGANAPQQNVDKGSTEGRTLQLNRADPGCTGTEEKKKSEAISPIFWQLENNRCFHEQRKQSITQEQGQKNTGDDTGEHRQSTLDQEGPLTNNDKIVKNKQQKQPNEPSLVLCDIERSPEKQNCISSDLDNFIDGETLGNFDAQENLADDSEFFKRLEMCHDENVLVTAEGRPKSCTSDMFIGDSGLSSFGVDVYMSRSSAECTSTEPDTLSLMEDPLNDSQKHGPAEMEQLCLDKHIEATLKNSEDDRIHSSCSHHLVDEGFSDSDLVESASRRVWGVMPIGPLLEDEEETNARHITQPPYWQRFHHRRQISLPYLAVSQPERPPGNLLPERSLSDTEASISSVSVLHHHVEKTNSSTEQIPAPYAQSNTPPLVSSPRKTLGDLYRLYGDSLSWQCWTRGDEEENEVSMSREFTPDIPVGAFDQHETDVLDLGLVSTGLDWFPSPKMSLTVDSPKIITPDSSASKKASSDLCETIEKPEVNASNILLGEENDVMLCSTPPVGPICVEEQNFLPILKTFDTLRNMPCVDLSTSEKRFVAQAMETEWGLTTTHVESSESDPSLGIAQAEFSQNSLRRRSQRYYRAAGYSPSEIHGIVDSGGSRMNRRAMARQAERAWGLAASSRCHWAGDFTRQRLGQML